MGLEDTRAGENRLAYRQPVCRSKRTGVTHSALLSKLRCPVKTRAHLYTPSRRKTPCTGLNPNTWSFQGMRDQRSEDFCRAI